MHAETNPAGTTMQYVRHRNHPRGTPPRRNKRQHGPPSELAFPATEPWPEPVTGKVLLDHLEQLVRRFVILPGSAPPALALWIVHTYAFRFRDVSTYLGIESPEKRCGKTTLLTVLLELVHRPSSRPTSAPPPSSASSPRPRPTLLIDEADTLLQGNDELRGILNSGYTRRTAFVVRVANALRSPLSPAQPAANPPQPTPPPSPFAGTQARPFLQLVSQGHGRHRPPARNPGRPLHHHPDATQRPRGTL